MLLRLPHFKFVIVTLGEDGCIMVERNGPGETMELEEIDVDELLESLYQKKNNDTAIPKCIPSPVMKLKASGIGTVSGRLFVGTAEKIPPSELIDNWCWRCIYWSSPLRFVLICHLRKWCPLLLKWQLLVVELWGLEMVFHIALILGLHLFYIKEFTRAY